MFECFFFFQAFANACKSRFIFVVVTSSVLNWVQKVASLSLPNFMVCPLANGSLPASY